LAIPAVLFNEHNKETLVKIISFRDYYSRFQFDYKKEHNEKDKFDPVISESGGFHFTSLKYKDIHMPKTKFVFDEIVYELYLVNIPDDLDNYVSFGNTQYKAGHIKLSPVPNDIKY
jgi:hypothetical protein